MAGPVISAVAVFESDDLVWMPRDVKDSKQIAEEVRDRLYLPLLKLAHAVGIGHAWPWEMDRYGPGVALQLSYHRAMEEIRKDCQPTILYMDGTSPISTWKGRQVVEPKADAKYPAVSAASIIAKVFRDTLMVQWAGERRKKGLPDYGMGQHKGYGTKVHSDAILKNGLLIDEHGEYWHRQSYCRKFLGVRPHG